MAQTARRYKDRAPRVLWRASTAALKLVARAVTLPYYQLFRQMTLLPVRSIAASVRDGDDPEVIAKKLRLWRERKSAEFQIVQVAGTLLAAAVIGSFSWDGSQQPHWIGPAAWYCSLILSSSAVLLASSQASIFRAVSDSVGREHGFSLVQELALVMAVQRTEDDAELPLTRGLESARVRWNLVFIWQAPTMMMSYSIIGFLVGLVVYVTAPLYNQESFDGSSRAAVVFLLCAGISGSMFMWCSFWGYRFEDPQTRIF